MLALLLIAAGLWWFFIKDGEPEQADSGQEPTSQPSEPVEPEYAETDLQPAVDAWLAKYSATYGIVVYDAQSGNRIAENMPDEAMFAASLYKMFVAYLALEDFQSGAQDPNEVISQGRTKKECVDAMIRSSDSPCGEAMMADMGQSTLNARVKEKGINNTTFNGIQTTAGDSAKILELVVKGEDLTEENSFFLRDAMRVQDAMYRRGLAKGAPEGIWDTKVGWNLDINYHDIGILTMPDGREFVVAILGEGSGSPVPIADFSSTIYSVLNQ